MFEENIALRRKVFENEIKPRVPFVVKYVMSNPSLQLECLGALFGRLVKWEIISSFEKKGRIVKCEICGREARNGFWCNPCIHPNWCCYCCIMMGIPFYR